MLDQLVVRRGSATAEGCARTSWAALEAARSRPELWLLEPTTEGVLRGAWQLDEAEAGVHRRASGGAEVDLGPGALHAIFLLPDLSLLEGRPDAILNRAVRPFLRAISRSGALAHYFGRDWVSAKSRPCALLGFAHEVKTQRTMVEVFVSVSRNVCKLQRSSYLDNAPATLVELAGKALAAGELGERIERAVLDAYGLTADAAPLPDLGAVAPVRIPARPTTFVRTVDEAIGPVGIGVDGEGHLRFGGELMVSFDALAGLEAALERLPTRDPASVAHVVEDALARDTVALFGVRSLETFVRLAVM